jgi:hypothetical protein
VIEEKMKTTKMMALAICVVLVVAMAGIMVTYADDPNPRVWPVDSNPYGMTYGEWSAAWWQWALAIPEDVNPILDMTGEYCGEEQSGKVWFLTGTFGGSAERTCTIPAGKAILFPVINAQCSQVQGDGTTERKLRECAVAMIDSVTIVEATVDEIPLQDLVDYRVVSPLFSFELPENNILDLKIVSPSVSDGYWILLKPLQAGEHTIYFRGVVPEFEFETEVTYTLHVR